MSAPSISLIIRCFNEEKHIGRLLYGITRQCIRPTEIIVVDSGSTDRTVEIASRFRVRVLNIKPKDFTFGRALNLGCSEARGEFLVFASAHVYPVYDDWLDSLLRPFDDERVGGVYGKQRGGEATQYSERQIFAQLFPEDSIRLQDSPFCNNANCAIRRSVWEETPYNEHLPGLEDLEWARRIMERGLRVSYAAHAEVIHIHEETPGQIMRRHMREAIALREIYPDQSMSFVSFLRLVVRNTLSDYLAASRDGEFVDNIIAIPRFRLMQFWGAYKGFRQRGPIPAELRRRFYYPQGLRTSNGISEEPKKEGRRIDYWLVQPPAK